MATSSYAGFLEQKAQIGGDSGFEPIWLPDFLFPFQRHLVDWAIRKGRAAIFADCGLGKTPMQLVWAENVRRKTGGSILILTPLAVAAQTIREAEKFGIEACRRVGGRAEIVVANYEQLHHFDSTDFVGVVCDESSILKAYSGKRRREITAFMRRLPYRLLCTATAAPNDHMELGTSAEALGELGYMDMLGRFFKSTDNETSSRANPRGIFGGRGSKWRFKKHAELPFWRWACSWSRSLRRPSDLGDYSDADFALPQLTVRDTVVETACLRDGMLFHTPAIGLFEQREERRMTIPDRCEKVAEIVDHSSPAVIWCHLNAEGDLLEQMIPDACQAKGAQSLEQKEEILSDFTAGRLRVLVTKPKIAGFGLNWQHCAHIALFPSHSYEQYYQAVRRCWRFGQQSPVTVDVVTTEGEVAVVANLKQKSAKADRMFEALTAQMRNALSIQVVDSHVNRAEVPSWL